MRRSISLAIAFTLLAVGCGAKDISTGKASGILVRVNSIKKKPGDNIQVDMSIAVNQEESYLVTVTNPGNTALTIKRVYIEYTPLTDEEKAGKPAFRLEGAPEAETQIMPRGETGDMLSFQVIFHRYSDEQVRKANVYIINDNDESNTARNFLLVFEGRKLTPDMTLTPPQIDFNNVAPKQTEEKDLTIENTGSGRLEIQGFVLTGDPFFAVNTGAQTYKLNAGTEAGITFEQPIVIEAGNKILWKVKFSPESDDATFATLKIWTNESGNTDKNEVPISGNAQGPKLKVLPNPIDFGGVRQGTNGEIEVTLSSDGTEDVVITDIAIDSQTNEFQPDFSMLSTGGVPTADNPLVLHARASEGDKKATFVLRYIPLDVSPSDAETGKPVPDTATLKITMQNEVDVPVSGYGVSQLCPMPVIVIEEGEDVPPQTTLHLDGGQSVPSAGQITSYHWSVQQPSDNKFQLVPGAEAQSPSHQVNVAETYTYCLDVCDSTGKCSNDPDCKTTACKDVVVRPTQGIHVELTWTTPDDPDPYDEGPDAGSDLDLHFAHPFATGPDIDGDGQPDPWFHNPYDCYWGNKHPSWESVNANIKDDPTLDRDDTDGSGPENLNLDVPKTGREYTIGVHYWNDHGYGDSDPTVKVFIYGDKVAEFTMSKSCGTVMHKHDMWTVATIKWRGYGSGDQPAIVTFVTGDGTPCRIAHDYVNPDVNDIIE